MDFGHQDLRTADTDALELFVGVNIVPGFGGVIAFGHNQADFAPVGYVLSGSNSMNTSLKALEWMRSSCFRSTNRKPFLPWPGFMFQNIEADLTVIARQPRRLARQMMDPGLFGQVVDD